MERKLKTSKVKTFHINPPSTDSSKNINNAFYGTYLVDESTDQLGLKEVAIRNPVEESEQGLQCCPHKGDTLGVLLQLSSCKLHGNTKLDYANLPTLLYLLAIA